MAFEYVGLDPCLKLVSAAFENPFGLEHLETAQQKRDQSKGGVQLGWTSVSLAPLSLATPHLSPQLSLSLHYLTLTIALLSPLEKYLYKEEASSMRAARTLF